MEIDKKFEILNGLPNPDRHLASQVLKEYGVSFELNEIQKRDLNKRRNGYPCESYDSLIKSTMFDIGLSDTLNKMEHEERIKRVPSLMETCNRKLGLLKPLYEIVCEIRETGSFSFSSLVSYEDFEYAKNRLTEVAIKYIDDFNVKSYNIGKGDVSIPYYLQAILEIIDNCYYYESYKAFKIHMYLNELYELTKDAILEETKKKNSYNKSVMSNTQG